MSFKSLVGIILIISLVGAVSGSVSVPLLPSEFGGSVTINGSPAPAGTTISAFIGGEERGSYVMDEAGTYGGAGVFDDRLIVQGSAEEMGEVISFQINGYDADQTGEYQPGVLFKLDLSTEYKEKVTPVATVTPEPTKAPSSGGGGSSTTEFTGTGEIQTSSGGKVLSDVVVDAGDGIAALTIYQGTDALDAEGDPVSSTGITPVNLSDSEEESEEEFVYLDYAWRLTPDGATFDPPATLTMIFGEDEWPDLQEEEPVVLCQSNDTGEWEILPTTWDEEQYMVTARCDHFSIVALFSQPAEELQPPEVLEEVEEVPPDEVQLEALVAEEGLQIPGYFIVIAVIVVILGIGAYILLPKRR
jgi:hypothetical protein